MEAKTCPDCGHAEHAPNQCERDNCGESEICHPDGDPPGRVPIRRKR